MKRMVLVSVTVAALAGSADIAAAQGLNLYIPPDCELDMQHFLVRNAALYVKAGTEARSPEQRDGAVQDAHRVLLDALEAGEEGNASVWYFLGRNYTLTSDLAGADSAFRRAEALAPDCASDIDTHRRFAWVPLYNDGITAMQDGDAEAAATALAEANKIATTEPFIPYYLASIRLQEQNIQAAVVLFIKMVEMGQSEGDYEEAYLISLFNAGRLHHMSQQWDSAAVWYARYRVVVPDDRDAITGLATVLESAGRIGEAVTAHDTVMAHADVVTALDLFSTGVSLFRYERFERAIRAFNLGLEKNPYYRDGLFNLTQSYFGIANPSDEPEGTEPTPEEMEVRQEASVEMLAAAKRLTKIDPFNESSMRLLAAAYQMTGDQDSTMAWLERIEMLPYEVTVEQFQPSANGYQLRGEVTNLMEDPLTIPGLIMEFVDAEGKVIESETFGGDTLDPEEAASFQFDLVGEGIQAWRYRLNRD